MLPNDESIRIVQLFRSFELKLTISKLHTILAKGRRVNGVGVLGREERRSGHNIRLGGSLKLFAVAILGKVLETVKDNGGNDDDSNQAGNQNTC